MKMKINMVFLLFIYLFVAKFNCLEYLVSSGIWFIYFWRGRFICEDWGEVLVKVYDVGLGLWMSNRNALVKAQQKWLKIFSQKYNKQAILIYKSYMISRLCRGLTTRVNFSYLTPTHH